MSLEVLVVGDRSPSEWRVFRPAMFAALLAMAGMSAPVMAQEIQPNSAQDIPSLALGVWTSKDGESKDDFARRVGAAAHMITETTGFEVCGEIAQENGGSHYRLALGTNQSQVGCMVISLDQPGYTLTKETLHTHPNISSFTPNAVDARMFHVYEANRGRYPVDGTVFSDLDFHSGAGYVVASGKGPFGKPRILYQAGKGTERDLGKVASYDLVDLAPDRLGRPDISPASLASQAAAPLPQQLGVTAARKSLP